MAQQNLLQLTDGTTTINFGGQDSIYYVAAGGFDLGDPPLVQAKADPSLLRSSARVIAHAHGNRPVTITFRVQGTSRATLQERLQAINALVERAGRAEERAGAADAQPVYLKMRLYGTTKNLYLRVKSGRLTLPRSWYGFNLVSPTEPYVRDCTLFLECEPYLRGEPRPVLSAVAGAPADYDATNGGLAVTSTTDYYQLGGTLALTPRSGIISFWHNPTYTATDSAEHTLLCDEQTRCILRKTTGNVLSWEVVDATVTTRATSIAVTADNFGPGWHHIVCTWGRAVDGTLLGLYLYLDGAVSTGGDTGSTYTMTALGRINIGVKTGAANGAAGYYDDVRVGGEWDGVYLTSASDLYTVGRDISGNELCSRFQMYNKANGTAPHYTDLYRVSGDVPPLLNAHLAFRPNGGSGGYTTGHVRIANRIAPTTDYAAIIEGEAMTLETGVTATVDSTRSGGNYITAALAAATAPTLPTVTPVGTTGSTSYSYYYVPIYPAGDGLPSAVGTTTTGNATLSATNYNRVSFTLPDGAIGVRILGRTGGNTTLVATIRQRVTGYLDIGSTVESTTYTVATAANVLQKVASEIVDGYDYRGTHRLLACLSYNGAQIKVQGRLWQGGTQFMAQTDVVDLRAIAVQPNTWTMVDLGQVTLPPYRAADGQDGPVTIAIYDTSSVTNPVKYDYLLLLPYEDAVPLLLFTPDIPFEDHQRLVFAEGRRLRYDYNTTPAGYTSSSGASAGSMPGLQPGRTNRIIVSVDRTPTAGYDLGASEITDEIYLYCDLQPRYLGLR